MYACEQEVGGYFILNGIERVVRMLIMQRRNYVRVVRLSYIIELSINQSINQFNSNLAAREPDSK